MKRSDVLHIDPGNLRWGLPWGGHPPLDPIIPPIKWGGCQGCQKSDLYNC